MSKFSVAPFVSQTVNGYQQTGFALLSNGFWVTRSSGSHIWAMSEGKARELAVKAAGSVATTPTAFVRWGAMVKSAPLAPQLVRVAAPGPFATAPVVAVAAPVVAAPAAATVQAASAAVAPKKPRTVAQCAATVKLCNSNAMRIEGGGKGDIGKARAAVATAFGNYVAACKVAGVAVDGDLEADAKYASGFDDLADDAAIGE